MFATPYSFLQTRLTAWGNNPFMVWTTQNGMFEVSVNFAPNSQNVVASPTFNIITDAAGNIMPTQQTVVSVCSVANLATANPPCVAVYLLPQTS